MARKAPAFQIYPDDWLSDTQLMQATDATQGRWMRALCRMWRNPQKGRLEGPGTSICKALNMFPAEFLEFIEEVIQFGFADLKIDEEWVILEGEFQDQSVTEALLGNAKSNAKVTLCNAEITLINRRMWREQKVKNNNAERQRRYKAKRQGNKKVTHPSPSPTPTPTNNNNNTNTQNSTIDAGTGEGGVRGEGRPPGPKKTNYPSKSHPAYVGFKSCFEVYPLQENEIEGWRTWFGMYEQGLLPEPFVIRDHIIERKTSDEKWIRYVCPAFHNFIRDQRWNDKYRKSGTASDKPTAQGGASPSASAAAENAWLDVMEAMRMPNKQISDETSARIVRTLFGGLDRLGYMPEKELPFRKRDFVEAYKAQKVAA